MQSNRTNWLIALSVVALLGTAVVTLRAAEQATRATAGSAKQHPPAAAPEESATIKDDPTTAPDPSQSADNNISFPTDT
jgi:hypothetical protein